MYIDDELITEDADATGMTNAIAANFADVLHADTDSYFGISNLSDQPHRFKLVPKLGASHEPPENSTPAYTENEDSSIEFCLSAASSY